MFLNCIIDWKNENLNDETLAQGLSQYHVTTRVSQAGGTVARHQNEQSISKPGPSKGRGQ